MKPMSNDSSRASRLRPRPTSSLEDVNTVDPQNTNDQPDAANEPDERTVEHLLQQGQRR